MADLDVIVPNDLSENSSIVKLIEQESKLFPNFSLLPANLFAQLRP
jgi:hypothetical protein